MPKIRKGCVESSTRPCCLLQINIDKKCTANCLLLGQNFFVPGHVLFQVCDISNILLIMYSLDKKRDNILLVSTRVFPYWEVEVVKVIRPFNLHPDFSMVPWRPDFSRVLSEIF